VSAGQAPRRLDAIDASHAHVHDHELRRQAIDRFDRDEEDAATPVTVSAVAAH
jgi:hypothetical protein